MEAKIDVGMFVRYKNYRDIDTIAKITDVRLADEYVSENYYRFDTEGGTIESLIIKASYDILDLIEKDDVVAYYNSLQDIKGLIIERVQDNGYIKRLREFVQMGTINIVQVMTKEQFEEYSYKIGG